LNRDSAPVGKAFPEAAEQARKPIVAQQQRFTAMKDDGETVRLLQVQIAKPVDYRSDGLG
jgi:hypothetical protein